MLADLKIAVLNRDIKKIEEISKKDISPDDFNSIEEMREYNAYLKMAIDILKKEKFKLSKEMEKLRSMKKFYSSNNFQGVLDISS